MFGSHETIAIPNFSPPFVGCISLSSLVLNDLEYPFPPLTGEVVAIRNCLLNEGSEKCPSQSLPLHQS